MYKMKCVQLQRGKEEEEEEEGVTKHSRNIASLHCTTNSILLLYSSCNCPEASCRSTYCTARGSLRSCRKHVCATQTTAQQQRATQAS